MMDARLKGFVEALARVTDRNDPMWQGLIALIDVNIEIEQSALCGAHMADSEAHRGRGRLGMLLDLKEQFDDLLRQAHEPPTDET